MRPDYTLLSESELLNELQDDAHKWAVAFMQITKDKVIDEGMMIGWFANAIETAHDSRIRRMRCGGGGGGNGVQSI